MYKIGTRGSLLAVTQATLIKNELERVSGKAFELVLIKTQGDQIVDRPLWQLEGKDFFTKELDEALLSGSVDLVIHSYKDLGSERPAGIKLGAITERFYAHDILLVPQKNVELLKTWQGEFKVGTSSPRRITNLTEGLAPLLTSQPITVRCETLRGNVNTRVQKLRDGQYHAITLALAGLDRLARGEKSRKELEQLLQDMNFVVLPLSAFPSAAAQGALAIELSTARTDGGALESIIRQLHHDATAAEVGRERLAFKGYGGGCHLAVGIHVRGVDGDFLHFHRGEKDGEKIQVKRREGAPPPAETPGVVFLGQGSATGVIVDQLYKKVSSNSVAPTTDRHVFVTTAHALPSLQLKARSLWSAGLETHKKMVQLGHWVNGCADNLGAQEIQRLMRSEAIRLMTGEAPWLVLSHAKARNPLGEVFAGYRQEMQPASAGQKHQLGLVTHAWWASYPQYEAYTQLVPEMKLARAYCGLGKTLQEFQGHGLHVTPLTDYHEFLRLMGKE